MEEYAVSLRICYGLLIATSIDVKLSELQKTLDTQGVELVENQKESVVGRKALADKTKGSFSEDALALC